MFKQTVKRNVMLVTHKPKLVIALALILCVLAGFMATGLDLELNWVALAPKGNPAVQEYESIIDNFPTLTNVIVVVESDDIVQMNEAVKALETEMVKHDDYINSMTTGLDQSFILDYGLLLAEKSEAEAMGYLLKDANLETFLATVQMMLTSDMMDNYTREKLENFFDLASHYDGDQDKLAAALKDFYSGNPLLLSENGRMTTLMIQPSFDMMDIVKLEPGVKVIEDTIKAVESSYPDVKIQATGMHIVARDETASIQSDSSLTTVMAIVMILLLLYFAFRSLSAPILTFVPLIIGIVWTVGMTQVVVGRLNMMTAFSAAMLLGLGIDYAIHMYSSYTERRANGLEKEAALDHAISISGPGIITGAITTAAAFFALNISQLELLRELGTIMGMGIIFTLISVFWVLPSLLTLKKEKEAKVDKIRGHYPWIGKIAVFIQKQKTLVIIIMVVLTGFMLYEASQSEFDLNLMNLEPKNLDSIDLMNYMVDTYDMSTDSFSVAVDSLADVYAYHQAFEKIDGVKEVTSIASFIPEDQSDRLALIDGLKKMPSAAQNPYSPEALQSLIGQLAEEEDGDQLKAWLSKSDNEMLADDFYTVMQSLSQRMLSHDILKVEDLPENYKQQFVSKDGSQYLISVYPDFDIWSNLLSDKGEQFFEDLSEVSDNVTGTPLFMKVLYDAASEEMIQIGLLLIAVFLVILMVHFRSIKYTVIAILPLILTMIFTVGTMHLIDLKFNILNFLSILLIIGIGIDDGVHILHHHKSGVRDTNYLFASVGRAILLTTLTTVCGFGSLIFSSYRGIASLGAALSIGVLYAFIMTIVVIPLVLKTDAE